MRFYQQQHGFYCGIDLHARTMHVCVVDAEGRTREHVNLPCDAGRFLKLIEPFREQLVVSCECLFAWYWLASRLVAGGRDSVRARSRAVHAGDSRWEDQERQD